MKIFIISDIHGNDDFMPVAEEIAQADLVLCAGDLTHFDTAEKGMATAEKLLSLNPSTRFVSGNCDSPALEGMLAEKGVSLHGKSVTFEKNGEKLVISGLGGSLTTPMSTPNTWSEAEASPLVGALDPDTDILLTHQPPYGSKADIVMKIKHVGSRELEKFIKENSPLLSVCGHIHESFGVSEIGKTRVVNPGSYREGRYAVVTVSGKEIVSIDLK